MIEKNFIQFNKAKLNLKTSTKLEMMLHRIEMKI